MQFKKRIKSSIEIWKQLRMNWIVSITEKFSILLFILSFGLLIWQWKYLPPEVPLWYNQPWGQEQLADIHWLFLLPLSGLIIYLLNILFSIIFTSEYLVFTQMASLSSLLISVLTTITLFKIIFLVR